MTFDRGLPRLGKSWADGDDAAALPDAFAPDSPLTSGLGWVWPGAARLEPAFPGLGPGAGSQPSATAELPPPPNQPNAEAPDGFPLPDGLVPAASQQDQQPEAATIDASVPLATIPSGGVGVSYGNTFSLHSLPGSTYKIYLDFDGNTTTGTSWNTYWSASSIVSPAFSLDGSTSFSTSELLAIQQIWQRVAEYYAPFNIDVTTEDPGLSGITWTGTGDTTHGIHVVITNETGKSYGGIAYTGSFNYSVDTPAFIYAANLGLNAKFIADAIAHEAGHALGLSHDGRSSSEYYFGHGSGATSWAPVMGAGYSATVVQWSNGGYSNATNTQDDLAIITTVNNGVTYRADDAGNTIATASALTGTVSNGVVTVRTYGIISGSGAQNDIDMYALTVAAGGGINLSVSAATAAYVTGSATPVISASPFSMLDVALYLYNAAGTLVASFDDPTRQDGVLSLSNLAGGTYTLAIDGIGWGTPMADSPTGWSEYGSLGQYLITGTYTASLADTTPPDAPVIAAVTDDVAPLTGSLASGAATNDARPTLSGTAEALSTVAILDGATPLGTVTASAAGSWSFTTSRLAEGAHSLGATATDAAGNVSAVSARFALVVDTTAPAAPVIAGPDTGSTPGLTGTAEAGSTVALYKGAALLGTATADAGGTWHVATDAAYSGSASFTATATDAAGNVSAASATYSPVALTLDHATLTTSEAGTTASAVLHAVNVTNAAASYLVTVGGLDATEGTLSATTLVLNAANTWTATLAVTGVDDRAVDGAQGYALTLSAAGLAAVTLQVTNQDDDVAAARITRTGVGTIDPAAFLAPDGVTSTLQEKFKASPGYIYDERWNFAGLSAGDYTVHLKASATEAMRLQLSRDGGTSWEALTGPDGKALALATSWDGDYLVADVADSLMLRMVDKRSATDAVQDSVSVDLVTLSPAHPADYHLA